MLTNTFKEDCNWLVIDHMKILSLLRNKEIILQKFSITESRKA